MIKGGKTESGGKIYVRIGGIYCEHCVQRITGALKRIEGVREVRLRNNTACISGEALPSCELILKTVRDLGYTAETDDIKSEPPKLRDTVKRHELIPVAAAIILIAFGLKRIFGYNVFNAIPVVDSTVSYGMLLVTGLLTSIHCLGMCGAIGIFASSESNSVRSIKRPLLYNLGRVVSYTVIGGAVGALGSVLSLTPTARGIIILAAAVLMLLMALSSLGLFGFRLPRLFDLNLSGRRFGAFVIGLLNGLMPCGPLQAMQLYALSTGSLISGAVSMLLFSLGTVPLMLTGGAALNLTRGKAREFIGKAASVLMLLLALSMLNRGLLAFGVDASALLSPKDGGAITAKLEDGVQTVEFELEYDSYADIVVQKGVPVRMIVHADKEKLTGCNNEIVSRELGFDVPLSEGNNEILFTPTVEGDFIYTCWMNMISNRITVIDDPKRFD